MININHTIEDQRILLSRALKQAEGYGAADREDYYIMLLRTKMTRLTRKRLNHLWPVWK